MSEFPSELPRHYCSFDEELWSEDEKPSESDEASDLRTKIEPWISALLQSDHTTLLIGSGLSIGMAHLANVAPVTMDADPPPGDVGTAINDSASREASEMGRGKANLEDILRVALSVHSALKTISDERFTSLDKWIKAEFKGLYTSILTLERDYLGEVRKLVDKDGVLLNPDGILTAFLLTFASRLSSRERLHIVSTNYDRFIEHGADKAGIRLVDRFVGALSPILRMSRLEYDLHYNPPGIRGEPRLVEGVAKYTKLHGSVDWQNTPEGIRRVALPFGADAQHPSVPEDPLSAAMVYPNPAKDIETAFYPYAELFRDFAASVCRPNSTIFTYGYGFGDSHINLVLADMLTIPSTHLVVISHAGANDRILSFCHQHGRSDQMSFLVGPHFGDLETLVTQYLPTPSIDNVTWRRASLLRRRTIPEADGDSKSHIDAPTTI